MRIQSYQGFTTGYHSGNVSDQLSSAPLFNPDTEAVADPVPDSLVFGSAPGGSTTRNHTQGGQFTIVWTNSTGMATVSIEVLHVW